jgi:hypothetical protein
MFDLAAGPFGFGRCFFVGGKKKIFCGWMWLFEGVFAKSGCFGVVFLWCEDGVLRGGRGV